MHVLIAPDRFSGPLNAVLAARNLADGWAEAAPSTTVTALPLSDGSAGLLDVVAAARGGSLVPVQAAGPLGSVTAAAVLHVPGDAGGTAYVEADQVIGTDLVPPEARAHAARGGSSSGLGALILSALSTGASRIVVGLPTPAVVHDGGRGLLQVLAGGETVGDLPDVAAARERLAGRDVVIAAADNVPLLGLLGAGALLGQDPDVGPVLAQELERNLGETTAEMERQIEDQPRGLLLSIGRDQVRLARQEGTGAGGGAAFALRLLGGRSLPGADVAADAVGLAEAVERADLVITGSAVLDSASLTTSVVATVARAALGRALPVVVVAEEVRTSRREVAPLGISGTYEIWERSRLHGARRRDDATDLPAAVRDRAARLARTWSTA